MRRLWPQSKRGIFRSFSMAVIIAPQFVRRGSNCHSLQTKKAQPKSPLFANGKGATSVVPSNGRSESYQLRRPGVSRQTRFIPIFGQENLCHGNIARSLSARTKSDPFCSLSSPGDDRFFRRNELVIAACRTPLPMNLANEHRTVVQLRNSPVAETQATWHFAVSNHPCRTSRLRK
jgi:hypothetical protein